MAEKSDRGEVGTGISGLTRRGALAAGSAAGLLALPTGLRTQGAPAILRNLGAPRSLTNIDHAVVYRREDEFCS